MKKISIILMLNLVAGFLFAQMPEKFVKAMEQKVPLVDTATNINGLLELANSFERIADAEKNQWLPYYYAALSNVNAG